MGHLFFVWQKVLTNSWHVVDHHPGWKVCIYKTAVFLWFLQAVRSLDMILQTLSPSSSHATLNFTSTIAIYHLAMSTASTLFMFGLGVHVSQACLIFYFSVCGEILQF
jgi:hypothetical protein